MALVLPKVTPDALVPRVWNGVAVPSTAHRTGRVPLLGVAMVPIAMPVALIALT